MDKVATIELEQIRQEIDLLISQLLVFKTSITELSKKIDIHQSQTTNPGGLTDSQTAELLNKREMAIQKRIDRLTKSGNKQ